MSARRNRRDARAWSLLLTLLWCVPGFSWAADDVDLLNESSVVAPLSTDRSGPFYDSDEPVILPRRTRAERVSPPRSEVPSQSIDENAQPSTLKTSDEFETVSNSKTPLPEPDQSGEETTPEPASRSRSGFSSSVIWAIGILGIGWIARQFLKSGGRLSMAAPSAIELLSRQSIGPQQQLSLIRLGRRIILVGTTPTGMSTLATVEDPAEVQSIVAELRPVPTPNAGPSLIDLFRSRRSEPLRDPAPRDPAPHNVSLSTASRPTPSERRSSTISNREVSDV